MNMDVSLVLTSYHSAPPPDRLAFVMLCVMCPCIGEHTAMSAAPHHRFLTIFATWCLLLSLFIAGTWGASSLLWLAVNILSLYAIYEASSHTPTMPQPEQFKQRAIEDAARRAEKEARAAAKNKDL
jgi:hypothetical protein